MEKFRTKPVVIEAIQFHNTKDGLAEVLAFVGYDVVEIGGGIPVIRTLEGSMKVSDEDWIIKGVAGEFYPCKPDIFTQTYERVEKVGDPNDPLTVHGLDLRPRSFTKCNILSPNLSTENLEFITCPNCLERIEDERKAAQIFI